MAFEITRQEILKQAIELKKLYETTRIQKYKDEELRLRRIVVELEAFTSGSGGVSQIVAGTNITVSPTGGTGAVTINATTPTLDQVTTAGNTTSNTIDVGGITTDYVQFDTIATPTPVVGMMSWDTDRSTVSVQLDSDVDAHLGQDNFWYVKNQSGSTIPKGKAVMAVGTLGASGRILIDEMVANGSVSAKYLLGVTAEDIANGADGFVINIGKLRQIDTSMYSAGAVLYCDPSSPGNFTTTLPSAPNLKLPIAFVVHSAANGTLAIRVNIGSDLYEDHRVQVNTGSLADGQLLRYDSTDQRWENWTPNFLTSVPTLAQVTTAGNTTTNSISVGGINATDNFVFALNRTVNTVSVSPRLRWTGSNVGTVEIYGDQNRLVVSASSGVDASSFQGNFVNFGSNVGSVSSPLLRGTNGFTGGLFFIGGGGVVGNAGIGFSIGNYTEGMRLVSTGNLLIGTTTDAGYKLDVNGSARSNALYVQNGIGTYGAMIGTTSRYAYTALTVATPAGSLSSGTVAHFEQSRSETTYLGDYDKPTITLANVDTTVDSWTTIQFSKRSDTASATAGIGVQYRSSQNSDLAFFTRGSNTFSEKMRITSAGNVLIGTTTDAGYKLDVNGKGRVGNSSDYGDVFVIRTPGSGWSFDYQYLKIGPIFKLGLDRVQLRVNNGSAYVGNEGDSGNASLVIMGGYNGAGTDFAPVIFGSGRNASLARETMRVDNQNQRVGIGTTTPSYKLEVNGTVSAQLTAATQTNQVYYNTTTGELTYGALPTVATPTLAQVTTAGNTTTNAVTVGGLTVTGMIEVFKVGSSVEFRSLDSNINFLGKSDNTGGVNFYGGGAYNTGGGISVTGNSNLNPSSIYFFRDGFVQNGRFFSSGNLLLGSGSTDAGYKLDVSGTMRSTNAAYFATSSGNVGIGTLSPTDTNSYGKALDIQSNAGAAAYFRDSDDTSKYFLSGFAGQTTNHGIIGTWGTDTLLRVFTSGNERMRIDSFGNVGIGTTAPGYKLEVAGTFRSSGAAYASGGLGVNLTGGLTSDFDVNGFAKVRLDLQVDRRIYVNDFLYIGTSTFSGYKLDVNGTARISGNTTVVGQVTATNGSDTTNLTSAGINMNRFYCYIVPLSNNSQTLFFGDVTKGVQDWAAISLKATNVELAANVGINTASPTVPLDVNGAARIQGNMNAQTYSVNGTAGWTGTITIPTNPPGQQNIAVNSGIITNVF